MIRFRVLHFAAAWGLMLIFGATVLPSPDDAARFYRLQRIPPGQKTIPMDRYTAALQQMNLMRHYSTRLGSYTTASSPVPAANLGGWQFLGPDNMGGRTRALVIDPSNPNIIFAGAASGGIWKSTDAGSSWTAQGDLLPNLSVNALAMAPTDHNILYAGTGEGYNGLTVGWDSVRGNGIYKTTDGGDNWATLAATVNSTDFKNVNDLVVSPNDSQRVYAATNRGIARSLDGGTTWTVVLSDGAELPEGCNDLEIRTDQTNDYIFAGCGVGISSVYRNTSAQGGGAWNSLQPATQGRYALAIAPSNQNIIYAISADNDFEASAFFTGFYELSRSTNSGDNWSTVLQNDGFTTSLNNMLLSNPYAALCLGTLINQGYYDVAIAVDPTNPDRVFVGGVDLFRSDDGGATWGLASNWTDSISSHYLHADQHRIIFHPGYDGSSNKQMFVTNDGGIYRTDDALGTTATGSSAPCDPNNVGINWTGLNNGYATAQFNHGTIFPDGTTYLGGTQNGGVIQGTLAGGPSGWTRLLSSVGGQSAVDPTNANTIYTMLTGISLQKSIDGGANFSLSTSGIVDAGLYISPFVMDSTNAQRLWIGGQNPWRSTDGGGTWTQASSGGNRQISALAVSPTNSAHVVVGRDGGHLNWSNNALTTTSADTWAEGELPRPGFASSVAFDPTDDNVVYVTYGSFNQKPSDAHIFKSTDGGVTWGIKLDGTAPDKVPDIPVNCILVNPNNPGSLYVGTDLGIFSSLDGGLHWAVENTGFANVPVFSLAYNISAGTAYLYAFTHGRGLWRVSLGSVVPPTVSMTAPADNSTVSDVILVSADADDDTGVARVDFYVDGAKIGTAASFPYEVNWDTKTKANGLRTLTARAIDLDNNSTLSAPITVTVDNPITALFQDDFDDSIIAPWTVAKGTWTESNGNLQTTTLSKNIIDGPPGTACGTCQINHDLTIITAGATVWVYGWYKDSNNYLRVELSDKKNKVTLLQKANGSTVLKKVVDTVLGANQPYNLTVAFASGKFQLYLNGTQLITDLATTQTPSSQGKVTYTVKAAVVNSVKVSTTVYFHHIVITP